MKVRGELVDTDGYEWAIVASFVALVPGALILCTLATIREARADNATDAQMQEIAPTERFSTPLNLMPRWNSPRGGEGFPGASVVTFG